MTYPESPAREVGQSFPGACDAGALAPGLLLPHPFPAVTASEWRPGCGEHQAARSTLVLWRDKSVLLAALVGGSMCLPHGGQEEAGPPPCPLHGRWLTSLSPDMESQAPHLPPLQGCCRHHAPAWEPGPAHGAVAELPGVGAAAGFCTAIRCAWGLGLCRCGLPPRCPCSLYPGAPVPSSGLTPCTPVSQSLQAPPLGAEERWQGLLSSMQVG